MIDLDAAEKLASEATSGPWTQYESLVCGPDGQAAETAMDVCDCALGSEPEDGAEWTAALRDAAFIAAARSLLPALCAELRAARAEREEAVRIAEALACRRPDDTSCVICGEMLTRGHACRVLGSLNDIRAGKWKP